MKKQVATIAILAGLILTSCKNEAKKAEPTVTTPIETVAT
jgi:hypothetical protein